MTKIDIISGFLGAGKTTFIKKMLEEARLAKIKRDGKVMTKKELTESFLK